MASEDHLIGNLTDTTTSEHSELIDHTFNQLSDLFFPADSNQSLLSPTIEQNPPRDTESSVQHHSHHHSQLQDLHSSCETLVGSSEDITSSIENLTKLTCLREKRLSSIPEQHTATTPNSEQDHSSLCFDRSTPQEIGLLSLRSSSDPAIALHTLQERQALQQQQQPSSHHISQPRSGGDPLLSPLGGPLSLPSFQETYSLKYSTSSSTSDSLTTELTIKMDEDCFPLSTSTEAIGGPALNQHTTGSNSNTPVGPHHQTPHRQHHQQHASIHSQLQNQHNLAGSHQHLQQQQQAPSNFSYHGHFNATTTPASSSSSASSYEFNNGSGNENVQCFNATTTGDSFYQQYQLSQPNVSIKNFNTELVQNIAYN